MCEALRELMKDEIAEALAESMEKGTDHAILTSVRNLMDTMKWTAEQAMEALKIPPVDRNKYASRL